MLVQTNGPKWSLPPSRGGTGPRFEGGLIVQSNHCFWTSWFRIGRRTPLSAPIRILSSPNRFILKAMMISILSIFDMTVCARSRLVQQCQRIGKNNINYNRVPDAAGGSRKSCSSDPRQGIQGRDKSRPSAAMRLAIISIYTFRFQTKSI